MFLHCSAIAVLAVCALTAFGAHEPAAPNEDPVSPTGAVDAAHATTNEVVSVSTNDIDVSSHQKLIDAWKDIENAGDAIPLRKVSLPISHYPDGSVRMMFHAREALFPQDEKAYLRARDIVLEMFAAPPAPRDPQEGRLKANNCIYDRILHDGYCEGWVRLQYRNVTIVGTNMTWNLDTRKVKITGGALVTIDGGLMKGMGGIFRK